MPPEPVLLGVDTLLSKVNGTRVPYVVMMISQLLSLRDPTPLKRRTLCSIPSFASLSFNRGFWGSITSLLVNGFIYAPSP